MLELFHADDSTSLVWSLALGAVGTAYFMYGKRMNKALTMGCGALLVALPYVLSGATALACVGLLICAVPYLSRFL